MAQEKVLRYFDQAAADYESRCGRGIWGYAKRRERAAILSALRDCPLDRVVDLGCGSGFHSKAVHKEFGCPLMGIDASPEMLKEYVVNTGFSAELGTLRSFLLSDPASTILCAGVLEFERFQFDAILKMASNLKASGRIILLVPKNSLWGKGYILFHRVKGNPVYSVSLSTIMSAAKSANLRLIRTTSAGPLADLHVLEKQ